MTNSRNLFTSRETLRPVEFTEFPPFVDAIRQSYWVHTHVNLSQDVQDFHTAISDAERQVLTRAMLAISQIEVKVKTFWGELHRFIPIPEAAAVGMTFAESEVRHSDAYAFLLDRLGLADEFEWTIREGPLQDRMGYLTKWLTVNEGDHRGFLMALVLFSLFIEYVSLFSQFYIIKSFYYARNQFKGMANLIEATSKEEELHGKFGFILVNLIRKQAPELFTDMITDVLRTSIDKSLSAEMKMLDWIFEDGDLDFVTRDDAFDFVKHRISSALTEMGWDGIIDMSRLEVKNPDTFEWFNVELLSTAHIDFFHKDSVAYNRNQFSFDEDDIFD